MLFRMKPALKAFNARAESSKTICIMGLGYIGLPTAAVLADRGYDVVGVDIRQDVVDTINRGEIHIHEPGLGELVNRVVQAGKLRASSQPIEADVFFICVPTPINADKSPDLSCVKAASQAIRPFVRNGNLVILESTSPPKTTHDVVALEAIPGGLTPGENVHVAYCPERVLPGQILREVVENDRIVGGLTESCTSIAAAFYESFVIGKVHRTNAVTAEMTKLVENAYRDVNIAFANEISMLAHEVNANAFEIIELANRHPRVNVLSPGAGVGGHCISVDPWFLVHASPLATPLIHAARQVNNSKPAFIIRQFTELALMNNIRRVGCLGLAYKPDVDDLRESPSLRIARQLIASPCVNAMICEPFLDPSDFTEFPLNTLDEVIDSCDAIILLTNHSQFRNVPNLVREGTLLIDTCGQWRSNPPVAKYSTQRAA
jgi:UDP-N-acetyl-D-mannosaminuronic acid dehydrogenase